MRLGALAVGSSDIDFVTDGLGVVKGPFSGLDLGYGVLGFGFRV